MKGIKINRENNIIEIGKQFEKKASIFGTTEYEALEQVRTSYPSFKIVVKKGNSKNTVKGLTFNRMRQYIELKNDIEGLIEFEELIGKGSAEAQIRGCVPYGKVKKWFLNRYPIFEKNVAA